MRSRPPARVVLAAVTALAALAATACSSGVGESDAASPFPPPVPSSTSGSPLATTSPALTPSLTPTAAPAPTKTFLPKPCARLAVGTLTPLVGTVQAQESGSVCAYTRGASPVLAVTYIDVGSAGATAGAERALSNASPVDAGPGALAWSGQATGSPRALVVVKGSRFATVVIGIGLAASRYPALARAVASAL